MARFKELLSGIQSATITDVSVLVHEVRVRIGVLSKYVTIRIFDEGSDPLSFSFDLSAAIQIGTDKASRAGGRGAPSENEALRRAVRMLTEPYDNAVRRGELPHDEWLVEQPSVRE